MVQTRRGSDNQMILCEHNGEYNGEYIQRCQREAVYVIKPDRAKSEIYVSCRDDLEDLVRSALDFYSTDTVKVELIDETLHQSF